jgi:hypothetical protein
VRFCCQSKIVIDTILFPRSGFPGLDLSSCSHELHRFRHSVTPERTNGQLLEGHKKYD